MKYSEFVKSKSLAIASSGFDIDPTALSPKLFDFQRDIVRLALNAGKFCIWADCGLGKGFMALEWAKQVCDRTQGDVLIVAPLSVSRQFVNEAQKLGVAVTPCKDSDDVQPGINVTNYERLEKFDCSRFQGVVLDESSVLKNYAGKFRNLIINSFVQTPYKLACSATPSPNDFMELGNHAEFMGVMSRVEMLAMFFTHDGGDTSKWRLKGHAEGEFWKWVCSWAVMLKSPSDLGYPGDRYQLPELRMHRVEVDTPIAPPEGQLLWVNANTLNDQRHIRRESLSDRCNVAADLANEGVTEQWLIWCDLNEESSMLAKLIPDAVEVKGSDSDQHKEESMIRFQNNEIRVLISKPSICGFGMNLQSCNNAIFVGLSHSFEAFYQAIRRNWRYGQEMPVDCYIVTHQLEGAVVANIKRKERDAETMQREMVLHMQDITAKMLHPTRQQKTEYNPTQQMEIPQWLRSQAIAA